MFIVPLDKSFHKVKCYSLTVTQASGTTVRSVVPRKKIPQVQILCGHQNLFIYSFNFRKQTSKQAKKTSKQLPKADGPTDRRRSTTTTADDRSTTTIDDDDRRRPIDDDDRRRPIAVDRATDFFLLF